MRKILFLVTSSICFFMISNSAFGQKVAFFRHSPKEDISSITIGKGSTVISAHKLKEMSIGELLEFDLLYIEGTGPGWQVALEYKEKINRAVQLGLGLYIVGTDPSLFKISPVDPKLSNPMANNETKIPVSAAWFSESSLELYNSIKLHQVTPVERAFRSIPEGFLALQEVHVGNHKYLPTILLGNHGYGKVILRTVLWNQDSISDTDTNVSTAFLSYLSEGSKLEPSLYDGPEQLASSEEF